MRSISALYIGVLFVCLVSSLDLKRHNHHTIIDESDEMQILSQLNDIEKSSLLIQTESTVKAKAKVKMIGEFIHWVKCIFKSNCAEEEAKKDHESAVKERQAEQAKKDQQAREQKEKEEAIRQQVRQEEQQKLKDQKKLKAQQEKEQQLKEEKLEEEYLQKQHKNATISKLLNTNKTADNSSMSALQQVNKTDSEKAKPSITLKRPNSAPITIVKGNEKNRTISFTRPESEDKDKDKKKDPSEKKEENKKTMNLTNSTAEPKGDKKVEVKEDHKQKVKKPHEILNVTRPKISSVKVTTSDGKTQEQIRYPKFDYKKADGGKNKSGNASKNGTKEEKIQNITEEVTKEIAANKSKNATEASKPAAEEKVTVGKKLQTNSTKNDTDKAIFDKFWYPKAKNQEANKKTVSSEKQLNDTLKVQNATIKKKWADDGDPKLDNIIDKVEKTIIRIHEASTNSSSKTPNGVVRMNITLKNMTPKAPNEHSPTNTAGDVNINAQYNLTAKIPQKMNQTAICDQIHNLTATNSSSNIRVKQNETKMQIADRESLSIAEKIYKQSLKISKELENNSTKAVDQQSAYKPIQEQYKVPSFLLKSQPSSKENSKEFQRASISTSLEQNVDTDFNKDSILKKQIKNVVETEGKQLFFSQGQASTTFHVAPALPITQEKPTAAPVIRDINNNEEFVNKLDSENFYDVVPKQQPTISKSQVLNILKETLGGSNTLPEQEAQVQEKDDSFLTTDEMQEIEKLKVQIDNEEVVSRSKSIEEQISLHIDEVINARNNSNF